MKPSIAAQITELRLKGLGYKSISVVVGTSKENVRYYCKTHGLGGTAAEIIQKHNEHRKNPEVCKYCGQTIERKPHSGKKLFCCDDHRRSYWREHPEESRRSSEATYECKCEYCNRTFYSYGNRNRKYCSHDCYILDRFWTDPDMKVDEVEIKRRQKMMINRPERVRLRMIS